MEKTYLVRGKLCDLCERRCTSAPVHVGGFTAILQARFPCIRLVVGSAAVRVLLMCICLRLTITHRGYVSWKDSSHVARERAFHFVYVALLELARAVRSRFRGSRSAIWRRRARDTGRKTDIACLHGLAVRLPTGQAVISLQLGGRHLRRGGRAKPVFDGSQLLVRCEPWVSFSNVAFEDLDRRRGRLRPYIASAAGRLPTADFVHIET